MNVIELLELKNKEKFTFSIELIPPKRGMNLDNLLILVEQLLPHRPLWIDVTSHSADIDYLETAEGVYQKRVFRKSPGTFGICAALKFKFGVETVPHLLCCGFTREETEDALIDLHFLGIFNVLALRGDTKYEREIPKEKTTNQYASDLVSQIMSMNQGRYLHSAGAAANFSVGVACYPEKHIEAPNLAYDLKYLKLKQDLGACYASTQMFYDNQHYYHFCERAKKEGVTMPIIPGIKIITNFNQLVSLPKSFNLTIPERLTFEFEKGSKVDKGNRISAMDVGVDWAYAQCMDLFEHGNRHVHFYVMQSATSLLRLLEKLKPIME
ncbi:MAG: methylenetetrahydrofolate reductase [Oligoflexia bacterium]|nr:methylenetetrahydrofolate reductase [Oligoflexia bacterium]